MPVHDAWTRADAFSLDTEGFALRTFRSQFGHWENDDAIREVTEFV
jgi:hypothetical protein